MGLRVGAGFDLHRLKPGRPFMLGCVAVEWPAGPWGHSDGDVLAHALADALLGGAGLGDIGEHFPDTDAAWQASPGERILRLTMEKVRNQGCKVVNADMTVFLERPRLKDYKNVIQERLAGLLGVAPGCVCVKAKSNEGFDAVGRGDCVAAHATVLLETAG